MIASTNLLVLIFYIHVALAHILPRQTDSSYPIEKKTIPSSPVITPGIYLPSGGITAGRYSQYVRGNSAHPFNGTISTVSPANASINTSLCPFVVQDTINIKYWPSYYGQELDSLPFNITSVVTAVTQYIDTIITRYTTNVIVTSTRTSLSWVHEESIPRTPPNDAQVPWRSITELKKDADLISSDSTFSSPDTIYIYPTARIITVPAVTQENGRLACTTAITRRYFYNQDDLKAGRNPCGIRVFTGMNSNVQRYFDSSKFSRRFPSTKSVGPAINLPTHSTPDVTSKILITYTANEEVLVLATPFAHKPSWNTTNLEDYGGYNVSTEKPCPDVFDHAIADYGYVPQAFIEFITQEFPEVTSRFPPGATLLPGGPSIIDGIQEFLVAPASLDEQEDLTVSTAFTVRNTGCFHPDVCLANDDAPNTAATTTVSTAQILIQRPNSREAIPTQASKTTFLASLADTQRETSILKSSAVASKASVASSAEPAHPAGEASITAKAAAQPPQTPSSVILLQPESHLLQASIASSAETAHPVGEASITTKAAALPSQSPLSVVLLDSKSNLVPAGVASSAETAHPAGEVSISTEAAALTPQSPSSVVLLNPESHLLLASGASSAKTAHPVGEASITTKAAALPLQSPLSVVLLDSKLHSVPAGVASSAETVHPAGEISISTKAAALPPQSPLSVVLQNPQSHLLLAGVTSLAETTHPAGKSPITTKAAALPPQSPSSILLQNPESKLLLELERVVQESFAAYLLPSVGSSQLTTNAAPKDIVDGQTFSPAADSPIAVSKTTSGLAPQVSALVINDGMPSRLPGNPGPVMKIGSQYLTAHSAFEYTIGSKTLVAGSTPIVVSGTTYSLAAHVSTLIVNGLTSPLSPFSEVKISTQYLTQGPRLGYILGSKTLIPGATPIVFSGTTYSMALEASILVANGVTSILHEQKTAPTSLPGSTPTSSGRLRYILAGQTLSPGVPAITVSGVVVSLAALGNTVVIDGTPFPLPTGTTPSLTISSQLLIATPASDLVVSDQMSQVGSTTSITSNGTTPSAANVVTGSTNHLLSTLTTSSPSGGVPPVSIVTSKASRGRLCFTQMLRLSLVVLGLTLSQAS